MRRVLWGGLGVMLAGGLLGFLILSSILLQAEINENIRPAIKVESETSLGTTTRKIDCVFVDRSGIWVLECEDPI